MFKSKQPDWHEAEMADLDSMWMKTPLLAMPPTGLFSLQYWWYPTAPGDGTYHLLQGHVSVFNTDDVQEAVEAFINYRDHAQ